MQMGLAMDSEFISAKRDLVLKSHVKDCVFISKDWLPISTEANLEV